MEIFEFEKNNQGYQTGVDLLKQVKNKALSITQAFYLSYSLLFLFNNTINHLVYGLNILQVKNMDKDFGEKQAFLGNEWFEKEKV